jgi:hypothetical protein
MTLNKTLLCNICIIFFPRIRKETLNCRTIQIENNIVLLPTNQKPTIRFSQPAIKGGHTNLLFWSANRKSANFLEAPVRESQILGLIQLSQIRKYLKCASSQIASLNVFFCNLKIAICKFLKCQSANRKSANPP